MSSLEPSPPGVLFQVTLFSFQFAPSICLKINPPDGDPAVAYKRSLALPNFASKFFDTKERSNKSKDCILLVGGAAPSTSESP